MPEQLAFTKLLNHLLAQPVTALLTALHFPPKYPDAPISNPVAMEVLVFGFLLLAFILVRSQLSIEKPGALQHLFEGMEGFVGTRAPMSSAITARPSLRFWSRSACSF